MNPYPGLRPFEAGESQWFFGRRRNLASIEARVRTSSLGLLVARSGVGKSSFLNCLLVPSLQRRGSVAVCRDWGLSPPHEAIERVVRQVPAAGRGEDLPIVVLDQFEDVFKYEGSRERLWEVLAEILNVDVPRMRVLVTMREEWLGAWDEAADYIPNPFGGIVRLGGLMPNEMRDVIGSPARVEGSNVMEEALVSEIAADVIRRDAYGLGVRTPELGLVQLLCNRLWEEAAMRSVKMTSELYHELGGVSGIVEDFVWKKLEVDGGPGRYTASERVMWVGLNRGFTIARGIKAAFTAMSLTQSILLSDLGLLGPAFVAKEVPKDGLKYLGTRPEKRNDIPVELALWVERTLQKGVSAGFLREGVAGCNEATDVDGVEQRLLTKWYELSHDSISGHLDVFSIEFERWIGRKFAILVAVVIVAVLSVPLAWTIVSMGTNGLVAIAFGIGAIVLYGIVGYIAVKIGEFVAKVLLFPIHRRLGRGRVPRRKESV